MAVVKGNAADSVDQDLNGHQFKMIQAKEIQADVTSVPISCDRVIVVGDLDLRGLECKPITITNSIVDGNVYMKGARFEGRLNFSNTTFMKKVVSFNSKFEGEAFFENATFNQDASFNVSTFYDDCTFDLASFRKNAFFDDNKVSGCVGFYNCNFSGIAQFYLSEFDGAYANFEGCRFMKDLLSDNIRANTYFSFVDSHAFGDADFHSSRFTSGASFNNATFDGYANFERSHFSEVTSFSFIEFNDTADLSYTVFDGPTYFTGSRFFGDVLTNNAQFLSPTDLIGAHFNRDLSMNSTKINTMLFDGATFSNGSRLYMAKADISRLMLGWNQIKDILVYDSSAYLSLVSNYKGLGLSEADECYYQYRYLSQEQKPWGGARLIDELAYVSCGYGVKPERPLICSFFLIMFCMSILWIGTGLKHPTDTDRTTSMYDALYYCIAIFFTIPLPDLRPVGRYRYVAVFLRSLSWTLFALLIATLGKVMIK